MDKNTAIEFQNVGKQYRLGRVGTGTLQHDINRWWQTTILRKEDPYLQVGEVNDRSTKGNSEYVWALKDISFKVEQGDVVGIIGKNGAGKSTLLKLLSHITAPSTGDIFYKGRIASLLEVGTGFHPEMTGRENIYMNGSILGMTRAEITRKLDEIVAFAGVERYIDTPVKRYSSGMTVRLGFAVAAFLEPEILVVDEVLTVGDAEFQKKAIGKMDSVAREGGRTVLFVSHNMNSVRLLCHHGVVLENGTVKRVGAIDECVDYYCGTNIEEIVPYCEVNDSFRIPNASFHRVVEFVSVKLLNDNPKEMATDEPLVIELLMKRNSLRLFDCQYSVVIMDESDIKIANYVTALTPIPQKLGLYNVRLQIKSHGLPQGRYRLHFAVGHKDFSKEAINQDVISNVLSFSIKYTQLATKREYLSWNRRWGVTVHDNENIDILSIG